MSNWDMFLCDARSVAREALDGFNFSGYGLDDLDPDVNPDMADEWKFDLVGEIVGALDAQGMLSGKILDDRE